MLCCGRVDHDQEDHELSECLLLGQPAGLLLSRGWCHASATVESMYCCQALHTVGCHSQHLSVSHYKSGPALSVTVLELHNS
jgi:hypothetical protein